MNVSIVVPAYNEAQGIRRLLTALLEQQTREARIVEIMVVASGCTDDTADVARELGRGRPGMHVHVQERREGKVAAINAYLRVRDPRADVVVVSSADLDLSRDVVEKMVCFLRDHADVGMVGARPMPNNDGSDLVGRMVKVLWDLHHRVALEVPKMGEIVAFRAPLVEYVSELSVVDEASIEDIVRAKGYKLGYVPDAIVTNHGPETFGEYFEQRRRVARGHYWLEFAFGYQVATLDRALLLRAAIDTARGEDPFGRVALAAAIGSEVAARAAGFWDARVVGGKHRTWRVLKSTKSLDRPGAAAGSAAEGDHRGARSADPPRRPSARPEPPRDTRPDPGERAP
ncbi:MAG TPA: glycosyltransferase family 2 protein [Polyangiaceae bacterium]|jgi:glycosyltransferase involved in cell wall biosynthesis